ncbi:MAG TPA: FecR family protein [Burkholderiales bacterium]
MATLFWRYGILIVAALLAAASPGTWAQAPAAGRLVSVTGEVGIVGSDGVRRAAERGGDIREGDTVVTGDSALAQARMSDGSLISVRADSEFKLEQFAYKGREDRSASFVVNILKGGFRTITGLIAQVNRSGYRINTPAATIGVRGTHFEVVHVLPQIASQQVPAGTYNRVFEGITTVQNPGGAVLQVVREQTAFAALQGGAPRLVAPPALLFGRPTPVPRAAAPQGDAHKSAAIKGESRALKMQDRAFKIQDRGLKSGVVREAVPTTPLESTTTLRSVPISPIETTTIQLAPTTTISPTLSTTTTISPTLSTTTTLSPTTTTTSPTLSTTTTISPTLSTTISPTTTTTTTTSPTTSTILQSPTTTTTTTTIIQR